MLVALMTIYFLGAGNTTIFLYDLNDLKKQVKTVVTEDPGRSEALNVVKAMKQRKQEHAKLIKSTAKELDTALENHAIPDTELDVIWDGYMQGVTTFHHDLIGLRFELKEHVSREQWAIIFPGKE